MRHLKTAIAAALFLSLWTAQAAALDLYTVVPRQTESPDAPAVQAQAAEGVCNIINSLAGDGAVSQIESVEIWASPKITVHMPEVVLNTEESELVNTYMTDILTLLQERMAKYILGTDTTSHEEFREKLKEYHIEEVTQCYQDACDRFNAR